MGLYNLTCVWKKSLSKEYNVLDIKSIGDYDIEWIRTMTCKEAAKKIEGNSNIKVAVIEDAKEKDETLVRDIMQTGTKVILLCGDLVITGAQIVRTADEVRALLVNVVNGELDDNNQSESVTEQDEARAEQTQRVNSGEFVVLNGVDEVKYEQAITERNRYRNLYETTKEELNNVREVIDKLMIDEEVVEFIGSGSNARELQNDLNSSRAEVEMLKKKLEALGSAKSEQRSAEMQLEKVQEELTKSKVIHDTDTEALDVLRQTLVQVSYYGRELIDEISKSHLDNKNANENITALDKKCKDLTNKLEEANKTIDDLNGQVTKLANDIEIQKENNESLSLDILQLEKEKANLNGELTAVRDKLNSEISKEEDNLDIIEEKERELAEFRSYKIDEMQNEIAQGKEMINECNKAIAELQVTKDALKEENAQLKQQVTAYSEMAERANNKMIAHDRIRSGDAGAIIPIKYMGKAILLAVYGSGGYGTTAVATAIAEKLVSTGYNVALIDFDFRSPKMDAIYEINPFKEELAQLIVSETKRTSVGALIKLGGKKWADNYHLMGTLINPNKGRGEGDLVYHAGNYESITATDIASADYETMLRKLGIEFDYIVLDMGRLEGSGSIANLQAGVSEAAQQNYLVTSSNHADIRSANLRALSARFRMANTCWVTNMNIGKLAPLAAQIVACAESTREIPFISSNYGTNFSLAENRKTASIIDMMCAYIK